jgi:hypothetical protein
VAAPNLLGTPGASGAAASLIQQLIVAAQLTTTAETTLYTVPASSAVKLAQGTLCNTSAGSVNLSLSLVPSGGVAGNTNRVIAALPIAPGDTFPLGELVGGHMLGPGDFISALADTANALTVVLSAAVVA